MPPVRFQKIHISDERYESAGVFDVNNDGVPDIVSGAYWYPGPNYDKKCKIYDVPTAGEYFDDFSTIPMDITGNGYLDIVTGGWWGEALRWLENPKGDPTKPWTVHTLPKCGCIETTRAWDIDGDGQLEIVPNTPPAPQKYYKLITDKRGRGTGEFEEVVIYDKPTGHGLGFGDISGSGRGDLVLANGWLEAPKDRKKGKWIFHEEFELGSASVPIIVTDVNGNGLSDLIVGRAHGYGLWWYEQTRTKSGKRKWIQHPIDPFNATYHDMFWVDIDGDGACELVTGKRYRAHCGHDPGDYDPYGMYYFKWTGENFVKMPIEYGPIRQTKGCGIFFQVLDLFGTGRLDIVAPGKDGLCIFKNLGVAENMGD